MTSHGDAKIRLAREADVDPTVSLLWDVAAEGRWIGAEVPFDRGERGRRLLDKVGKEGHLLLVADAAGAVVGHLSLDLAAYGTADLGMALREGWRGRGLGRAMLRTGIDWARAAGAVKISLEVWPHNEAARSLYVRLGFVEEGRKRRHYRRRDGQVWDAILMGLALDGDPWPVRPAADDDGWDLVALVAGCWAEYPGCVLDAHGECPDLLAPATAFGTRGGAIWVVEGAGGDVVASVGIVPVREQAAEMQRLYVARRVRRRGLARHLVGLVEAHALTLGAVRIELWCDSRFTAAHHFYTAAGYHATGATRALADLSSSVELHFDKELAR